MILDENGVPQAIEKHQRWSVDYGGILLDVIQVIHMNE